MKATRDTPTLSLANLVPWGISAALFFGIMAFVTPGVLLAFAGVRQGLLFAAIGGAWDLPPSACSLNGRVRHTPDAAARPHGWHGWHRNGAPPDHAQVAHRLRATGRGASGEVDQIRDTGSGRIHSRPVLRLADGHILPITRIYPSGSGAQTLVKRDNSWLNDRYSQ